MQYDGSLGGGKVVNWGFPFETITSASVRDAYMSDVLKFFGVLSPPNITGARFNPASNSISLSWNSSSGLKYRVQYKSSLTDVNWVQLGADVVATNTISSMVDTGITGSPQKFYRVLMVN